MSPCMKLTLLYHHLLLRYVSLYETDPSLTPPVPVVCLFSTTTSSCGMSHCIKLTFLDHHHPLMWYDFCIGLAFLPHHPFLQCFLYETEPSLPPPAHVVCFLYRTNSSLPPPPAHVACFLV
ncbi:hypothetical protein ElyMa_003368700 [Elysia marginata]|uniref:Uncharacterized protein n=1 Tax=Elysia marginata TaxID=1093978 RepID=A0AAV4JLP5_9GAST|nr:hypothetical protein ElyMa_003368700 [Elysia marginata]